MFLGFYMTMRAWTSNIDEYKITKYKKSTCIFIVWEKEKEREFWPEQREIGVIEWKQRLKIKVGESQRRDIYIYIYLCFGSKQGDI